MWAWSLSSVSRPTINIRNGCRAWLTVSVGVYDLSSLFRLFGGMLWFPRLIRRSRHVMFTDPSRIFLPPIHKSSKFSLISFPCLPPQANDTDVLNPHTPLVIIHDGMHSPPPSPYPLYRILQRSLDPRTIAILQDPHGGGEEKGRAGNGNDGERWG